MSEDIEKKPILISGLPVDLIAAVDRRAAANLRSRSMEIRAILTAAVREGGGGEKSDARASGMGRGETGRAADGAAVAEPGAAQGAGLSPAHQDGRRAFIEA